MHGELYVVHFLTLSDLQPMQVHLKSSVQTTQTLVLVIVGRLPRKKFARAGFFFFVRTIKTRKIFNPDNIQTGKSAMKEDITLTVLNVERNMGELYEQFYFKN